LAKLDFLIHYTVKSLISSKAKDVDEMLVESRMVCIYCIFTIGCWMFQL